MPMDARYGAPKLRSRLTRFGLYGRSESMKVFGLNVATVRHCLILISGRHLTFCIRLEVQTGDGIEK